MAYTEIYVDVECPECYSENVEITDKDENTFFCRCRECKKRFQKMRT